MNSVPGADRPSHSGLRSPWTTWAPSSQSPAVRIRPPIWSLASRTVTRVDEFANASAHERPPIPAPITATSAAITRCAAMILFIDGPYHHHRHCPSTTFLLLYSCLTEETL